MAVEAALAQAHETRRNAGLADRVTLRQAGTTRRLFADALVRRDRAVLVHEGDLPAIASYCSCLGRGLEKLRRPVHRGPRAGADAASRGG